jgi:hypothetical protein
MHRPPTIDGSQERFRDRLAERNLRHDGDLHQLPLGCSACREKAICGGLAVHAVLWDCLSLCCKKPWQCDRVCRNNPNFAKRVHETGGFSLMSLPPGNALPAPSLPSIIPEIFHGKSRRSPLAPAAASVSLYRLFDRRTGIPRFGSHHDLCAYFGIAEGTPIVLTGIQRDRPLERWWELGKETRRTIIRSARKCGAVLATSPNYSLFLDRPRWDDLHAIMRIALVHQEFLEAGMPAALHVNGRTEMDFRRWAEFIEAHPEITHLAYEFTTGTGRPERRRRHANWLSGIALKVGRPLRLLVRGGVEVLPELCEAFAGVIFLETTTFLKTMMRYRAVRGTPVYWWPSPTAVGEPLDDLYDGNWEIVQDSLLNIMRRPARNDNPEVAIA